MTHQPTSTTPPLDVASAPGNPAPTTGANKLAQLQRGAQEKAAQFAQSAPVRSTWQGLRSVWLFALERSRQERILQVASSLTFTTALSLVPLIAVGLALFTAFPLFENFRGALEEWLIDSLLPDEISDGVMLYLNQFAGKAGRVGAISGLFLLFTAISLMLTVDRTVNEIFKVSKPRPLLQRVLVYWAVLTLGPLILGASLWITGSAVAASRGWVQGLPLIGQLVLSVLPVAVMGVAIAASLVAVPNCKVLWTDALIGGLITAIGFDLMKHGFATYIGAVDTSAVYGPLALIPLFLLWIYLTWVVLLFGAAIVASMPVFRLRAYANQEALTGQGFIDRLTALVALMQAQQAQSARLSTHALALHMHWPPVHARQVLDDLCSYGYAARLDDQSMNGDEFYALTCDLSQSTLEPLLNAQLLEPIAVPVANLTGPYTEVMEMLWPHEQRKLTLLQIKQHLNDKPQVD